MHRHVRFLPLVALFILGCDAETPGGPADGGTAPDGETLADAPPPDATSVGCDDGVPVWSEMLGTDNGAERIVVRGNTLYVSDYKTDLADTGGRLYSVGADGSNAEELLHRPLVDGRSDFRLVGADAEHIYWVETHRYSQVVLMRMALAGGAPLELARLQNGQGRSVYMDDTSIYVVTSKDYGSNVLNHVSKDTGAVQEVDIGPHGGFRGVDEQRAYMTQWGELWAIDKYSGEATQLADAPDQIYALVFDQTHVYYATNRMVARVAKTGGKPEPFANLNGATALAHEGHYLYFKRDHDYIQRVPKQGGEVRDLMCQQRGYYDGALTVAGGRLFWAYHNGPEWGVAHASAEPLE